MTLNPQPHPLRCETCENKDCQITVICADTGCDVSFNPRDPIEKTLWFVQGIEQVGCASHSSANTNAAVLDEFITWCNMFDDYSCDSTFTPSFILKKIIEIRQQERKP